MKQMIHDEVIKAGNVDCLRCPWGGIKSPMAEYAGTTFTTQQSLDILAFLLQKNGYPAGREPLTDTRELSDVIPSR